jgi:hypothetical protein
MSGLLLQGVGPGTIQFQMPTVVDQSTGRPFAVPTAPATFNFYAYGLLQYLAVPLTGFVHPVPPPQLFAPNNPLVLPPNPPALISRFCSASSSPINLSQQLLVSDAAGNPIEKWQVVPVSLFNGGPAQLMWRGSALPGGSYGSPFTLTASGFSGESWQFQIPGFI